MLTQGLVQGLVPAAGGRGGGSLPVREGPGLEAGVTGGLSINKFRR